jgi:microsomal dipeptidase-like Zn-dependent dipeptidase
MNGVPGVMSGYRDGTDFGVLLEGLRRAGLSEAEIADVAGENFVRLFTKVRA